jgi:uncharacterized SAM-binding protein YcdF (DUF218 family)
MPQSTQIMVVLEHEPAFGARISATMFAFLKALARSLFLPPTGPLIFAIAGSVLMARRRKVGRVLLIAGLASLWLLATPVVADALSGLAERYPALDLSRPVNAQAIVILGGGGLRVVAPEYAGGPAPELDLLDRLSYGAFVAHHTSLPVLVSGSAAEANAMRICLARDFGVSTRWLENQSRDTYENAHFSALLLRADGINRIVLVTSSAHLWRAAHEFASAGLQVVPAPVGVLARREIGVFRFVPSPAGLLRSHAALYELIGEPLRELLAALHWRQQQSG